MKLVHTKTGKAVQVGDVVTLSDGEKVEVTYFREPHKSSSSGKVSVQSIGAGRNRSSEYYVGVIGAEWIEREDQTSPRRLVLKAEFILQPSTHPSAENGKLELLEDDGSRVAFVDDRDEAVDILETLYPYASVE